MGHQTNMLPLNIFFSQTHKYTKYSQNIRFSFVFCLQMSIKHTWVIAHILLASFYYESHIHVHTNDTLLKKPNSTVGQIRTKYQRSAV